MSIESTEAEPGFKSKGSRLIRTACVYHRLLCMRVFLDGDFAGEAMRHEHVDSVCYN